MNAFRKRHENGVAVLEFALSSSVLIALLAGVFQFGHSFFVYNQLMVAVSNAGELGSKMNYDTANPSAYSTALKNMVVYGDTTAGTSPIVLGLTTSNVHVNSTLVSGIPVDVTVSITGYQVDAVFTKFSFSGKPRATFAYMGHVVCSAC